MDQLKEFPISLKSILYFKKEVDISIESDLTRITISGCDREDGRPNGNVLVNLLGVALQAEHGRVVVQIHHVAVHGEGRGHAGLAIVLRLNDKDVVLYLCKGGREEGIGELNSERQEFHLFLNFRVPRTRCFPGDN